LYFNLLLLATVSFSFIAILWQQGLQFKWKAGNIECIDRWPNGILILENFGLCKLKASIVQKLGPHSSAQVHSIYKVFTNVLVKSLLFIAEHVYHRASVTRTVIRIEKQLGSIMHIAKAWRSQHENNISEPKFHLSSEWISSTDYRLAHTGTYWCHRNFGRVCLPPTTNEFEGDYVTYLSWTIMSRRSICLPHSLEQEL
jgi:hypothetical protein